MCIDEKSPGTKVLNSFVKVMHKAVFIFPRSIDATTKEIGSLTEVTLKKKYNRLLSWVNISKVVVVSIWTVSFSFNSSNGFWDWSTISTTQQYIRYSSGFILELHATNTRVSLRLCSPQQPFRSGLFFAQVLSRITHCTISFLSHIYS